MVNRVLDIVLRRPREIPTVPVCPEHQVEMRLRGKMGRPTRFSKMMEEEYTLIYFCPVPDCNHTAERQTTRSQIPVPGAPPQRPIYSRRR